jgi:hypothetical protein
MPEEECDDEFKDLKAELVAVESCLDDLLRASPDDERPITSGEASSVLKGKDLDNSANKFARLHRAEACKCLFLTRLPAILALHVQRRYYNPSTGRNSKTFQHVIFPEFLDVSPFCAHSSPINSGGAPSEIFFAGDTRCGSSQAQSLSAGLRKNGIYYRLMSVIEHRGGAEGGHYVCFRRDISIDRWLFCSDDVVKPCDWSIVKQAQAYMLFYEAL